MITRFAVPQLVHGMKTLNTERGKELSRELTAEGMRKVHSAPGKLYLSLCNPESSVKNTDIIKRSMSAVSVTSTQGLRFESPPKSDHETKSDSDVYLDDSFAGVPFDEGNQGQGPVEQLLNEHQKRPVEEQITFYLENEDRMPSWQAQAQHGVQKYYPSDDKITDKEFLFRHTLANVEKAMLESSGKDKLSDTDIYVAHSITSELVKANAPFSDPVSYYMGVASHAIIKSVLGEETAGKTTSALARTFNSPDASKTEALLTRSTISAGFSTAGRVISIIPHPIAKGVGMALHGGAIMTGVYNTAAAIAHPTGDTNEPPTRAG